MDGFCAKFAVIKLNILPAVGEVNAFNKYESYANLNILL